MNISKPKRPRVKPLPLHSLTINQRMSKICNELGIAVDYINKMVIPQYSSDQRMLNIQRDWSNLTN